MVRIAESRDDVLAIVEAIKGRRDPSALDRIGGWLLAFLIIFAVPTVLLGTIVEHGGAIRSAPFWVWLVIGAAPFLAAAVALEYHSSYMVDDRGFRRVSPLSALSWSVQLADVHAIDLDFISSRPKLILRTTSDQKHRFPLLGFRSGLSKLYPILSDEPLPAAYFRVRPAIVIFAVVSIAAVLALAWYLTHIGLTAWR